MKTEKDTWSLSEEYHRIYCKKCNDKHLLFFQKDVAEFIRRLKGRKSNGLRDNNGGFIIIISFEELDELAGGKFK